MSYRNYHQEPRSEKFGLLKNISMVAATVGLIGFGAAFLAGNKGHHNLRLSGEVLNERIVYGGPLRGYSTDRPGLIGAAERVINDVTRAGDEMHLYEIGFTRLLADRTEWFKTVTDTINVPNDSIPFSIDYNRDSGAMPNPSVFFYLQTEGDVADVGSTFQDVPMADLGRRSFTFTTRGIRFTYDGPDGDTRTKVIKDVWKEPKFDFSQ